MINTLFCSRNWTAALIAFSLPLFYTSTAVADDEPYVETLANSFDFQMLSGVTGRLEAHGNELMGDRIDKKTGGMTLEHVDISIPGNSGLDVALRRKLSQGEQYYSPHQRAFGNSWKLDLPMAYVAFGYDGAGSLPDVQGGCVQSYGNIGSASIMRSVRGISVPFDPWFHTDAMTLSIPGKGLSGFPSNPRSSVGLLDHKADWRSGGRETDHDGRCAEVVIASDGTKYRFGRHIFRTAKSVSIPVIYTVGYDYGALAIAHAHLGRKYLVYLITEVEDVHGNWVRYEYTNDTTELTRIISNDNREITLHYHANSERVSHATAHGRTWNYEYDGYALDKVVLPDGRFWELNRDPFGIRAMMYKPYLYWNCVPADRTFSIKHPDGAIGTFTLRETRHIKSAKDLGLGEGHYLRPQNLPRPTERDTAFCNMGSSTPGEEPPYGMPVYRAMSLVKKTISAPNLPEATWDFEYRGYTGGALEQTWTKITEPDDTELTYTYQAVGPDHGLLKRIDVTSPDGAGESFIYEHDLSQGPPSDCSIAGEYGDLSGACLLYAKRPVTKVTRLRDGVTYTTLRDYDKSGGQFIDKGRPNKITRYSTLQSGQRIVDVDYWHNTSANIIGRTQRVVTNGKEFTTYDYNSKGQPNYVKSMGSLWETYSYHPDGTLKTITDSLEHTATLSDYHRGQPQLIARRDDTTLARTVNDSGWITSETNARGYTTEYGYTAAGWMTLVDRPSPWADTNISYHNQGESSFYRRITQGTKETVEWFDSMLRPRLVRERPLSGGGVTRYVKTQYDELGRTIFTSQPSSSSNPSLGTNTTYDGLGRVIQTRENFGLNVTNTIEYLSGNRVRVTDPLGHQTTITRSGYSSPNDGQATAIQQPEYVKTVMTYDIYGNMLTARQHRTYSGYPVDETQSYVYDSSLRLCRHTTPETGSTLYAYDNANQLTGVARGQSSGSTCASLPSSAKVARTYDNLGRVTLINYPGSTPDTTIVYDANGNVTQNLRGIADWRYTYDSADQLTEEKLLIDGRTYETDYTYNSIGAVASSNNPDGRLFDYAPNGLGQATRARTGGINYASAMSYYPNGKLNSLSYSNGRALTELQNARQLTTEIKVANGGTNIVRLTYSHDDNGRVLSLTDHVVSGQNRTFGYDGLGRLTSASGPWGSGSYHYDALGNLRQKTLGSRVVDIEYNADNRLSRHKDTAAGNTWQNYSYDSRGNVTDNGPHTFTYDWANQPTSLGGATAGSFVYDGNLKRVKQTIDGKTIYSVYGLAGDLQYRDNITDNEQTSYGRAAGRTIVRFKGSTPHLMYNDHLGSPVAAETTSGSLVFREDYTPFGEKRQDPSQLHNDEGFTGHVTDTETGLTYMQARYYDPVIGRFLSNDPVGFTPAVPQMHNRYAYTLNDPINFIDPGGRDAVRVRFADQKIGIPDTDRDFYQFVSRGHSGSLIIRSDGLTKYREYGRYQGGGTVDGAVRKSQIMTNISFVNGIPSADSLRSVFTELLEIGEAAGSTDLRLTFDLDADDYDAMMKETTRWDQDVEYSVPNNTCHGFCEAISEAGGGDKWFGKTFNVRLSRDSLDKAIEQTREQYENY